jgi:hypothetical protein
VKTGRKGLELKKPELIERIAAGEERMRARVR